MFAVAQLIEMGIRLDVTQMVFAYFVLSPSIFM